MEIDIKEPVVSFEVAQLLKENNYLFKKHFYTDYYNYKGELNGDMLDYIKHRTKEYESYTAPTLNLVCYWLETLGYTIKVELYRSLYSWIVYKNNREYLCGASETKEESLNDAISYLLKTTKLV